MKGREIMKLEGTDLIKLMEGNGGTLDGLYIIKACEGCEFALPGSDHTVPSTEKETFFCQCPNADYNYQRIVTEGCVHFSKKQ